MKVCQWENTRKCRNGSQCKDFHPIKTCLSYSKIGSCLSSGPCKERHPTSICHAIQNTGNCQSGDSCRYRHQIEYIRASFLGSSPPKGPGEPRGDPRGRLSGGAQMGRPATPPTMNPAGWEQYQRKSPKSPPQVQTSLPPYYQFSQPPPQFHQNQNKLKQGNCSSTNMLQPNQQQLLMNQPQSHQPGQWNFEMINPVSRMPHKMF